MQTALAHVVSSERVCLGGFKSFLVDGGGGNAILETVTTINRDKPRKQAAQAKFSKVKRRRRAVTLGGVSPQLIQPIFECIERPDFALPDRRAKVSQFCKIGRRVRDKRFTLAKSANLSQGLDIAYFG
jgi:hypothetical protein